MGQVVLIMSIMSSRDYRINKLKDLETIEALLVLRSTISFICVNGSF